MLNAMLSSGKISKLHMTTTSSTIPRRCEASLDTFRTVSTALGGQRMLSMWSVENAAMSSWTKSRPLSQEHGSISSPTRHVISVHLHWISSNTSPPELFVFTSPLISQFHGSILRHFGSEWASISNRRSGANTISVCEHSLPGFDDEQPLWPAGLSACSFTFTWQGALRGPQAPAERSPHYHRRLHH